MAEEFSLFTYATFGILNPAHASLPHPATTEQEPSQQPGSEHTAGPVHAWSQHPTAGPCHPASQGRAPCSSHGLITVVSPSCHPNLPLTPQGSWPWKVQAGPRTLVFCSPSISSTSLAIEIPCQGVSSVLFLALLLGFLDQTIDFLCFCVVFSPSTFLDS